MREAGLPGVDARAHIIENDRANADQRMRDPRQSAAVFRSEVPSDRTDAAKYRLSGMTGIAVKRRNRHSRSPSRAFGSTNRLS